MHIGNAGRYFERTRERDRDVTHGHGHGVAIDEYEAAFVVHDDAGTVVMPFGDPRDRKRQVEVDEHERRRKPCRARVVLWREARRADHARRARRAAPERFTGPDALCVVALADPRRVPGPVHAHDAQLALARRIERDVSKRHACIRGQRLQHAREIVDVSDRLPVHFDDNGAPRNGRVAEHVARVGDEHAARGQVVVARLLIGQRVHDRVTELEKAPRRDRVQVADR